MASGLEEIGEATPEKGAPAEELEYRLRQQQLAAEFALFALKNHDIQALLQETARVCALGLRSRFSKVVEYLPEEQKFLVRAGVGWKPGIVGRAKTGADKKSPAGYAFWTGASVISNHLGGESRFRTPHILAEHGVKRAINSVIRRGEERFGVLEVDSPVEGRFTDADLVFVTGLANLLGVALERQQIEEVLKTKEALLQKAVAHQKMLADEVSHRVKNGLAMVAGLLRMQARALSDPELRQALADAQLRVQAIARIHELLGNSEVLSAVNLPEFLEDLCSLLKTSAPEHEFVVDVVPAMIATSQAVSLGLLVNELVTNALKYAYPDSSGPVFVSVTREGDLLRFEIADHGVGLSDTLAPAHGQGLGKKVIASLSAHLGGEAEWQDANPGTRFVLRFCPEPPGPA